MTRWDGQAAGSTNDPRCVLYALMMPSSPKQVAHFLRDQFNPDGVPDLSLRVTFVWGEKAAGEADSREHASGQCTLSIAEGRADIASDTRADVRLVFSSREVLWCLLHDNRQVLDAFLGGAFRSDGGLPFIFPLLAAFGGRAPDTGRT